ELYTTEESYHRLLTVIQTRYMQPMSAAASYISTTKPFISSTTELMPLLFRHLPNLLALSEKILAGLKRILQLQRQQLQLQYVGQLFCSLEQDLVVFLKYAVHYESNIKSIRRACATNSMFLKIEQEGIAKRETNRMGFADYLIAPFQRVPRYCLLIK
ncbi:Dbl homology domain-containing protein, partial [Zychaea mexicana]|uniref:rho guanine nucleotide exchange factor n=1 Tax=Zychaea mexicana TaxID=64656 RepID=UPI0022FDDFBE